MNESLDATSPPPKPLDEMSDAERAESLRSWDRITTFIVVNGVLGLVLCGLQFLGQEQPDLSGFVAVGSWLIVGLSVALAARANAADWRGAGWLVRYLSMPATLVIVILLWDSIGPLFALLMPVWLFAGLWLRRKAHLAHAEAGAV